MAQSLDKRPDRVELGNIEPRGYLVLYGGYRVRGNVYGSITVRTDVWMIPERLS